MVERTKVGVIGLGAMGSGMVSTLLRNFFDVTVYDLDPTRVERCVTGGAREAASAAELVASCPVVMLSLPKSQVTVSVIEGEILPVIEAGKTVIDLGTTVVADTRRLHAALKQRGANLIDAPVSGGTIGSAKGELYCFAAGDRDVVEKHWSLLKTIGGGRLTYCGAIGCGQVTKAVNQLAMGFLSAGYTEAVAYGVACGVDADVLLRAVGGSSGFRSQFEQVASRIVNGDGDAMDHKLAEFDYFLNEADRKEFDAPIMRGLYDYLKPYPLTGRDNMNRPYAPFWSVLMGKVEKQS